MADAAIGLSDLSAVLGHELHSEEFGSLGGLLLHEVGRVPAVGDEVALAGLTFIVRDGDEKRISRVEIIVPDVNSIPAPPGG